jgi:alpha-mannosidase
MKTVHMIGNAHLDPVWLWRREEGLDAVLATARSACDRLDEFSEFVFTCSASWMHERIETVDPALFERVRAHVAAGRWRIAGGMLIEPDCNLPSAESFRRQLRAGQTFFSQRFGQTATVGYNLDSFGHGAYLPRFLREAGIDSYVFMRPDPREKTLPANLFTWRSPDGAAVTAFRLPWPYATRPAEIGENVERALAHTSAAVEHTMCFFGVGDHGGGPTQEQIRWIMAHRDRWPGARLVFSHPRAFFDAVAETGAEWPTVEGELQHHAIGCYSVERRIKTAMRRAEARLDQAQRIITLPTSADPAHAAVLETAWHDVLFNQFHDILGGTSLEDASRLAAAELEAAAGTGLRIATEASRRAARNRATPGVHRIAALNAADEPFEGLLLHEPWLDMQGEQLAYALHDETGRPVPMQLTDGEAMVRGSNAALMRLSVPARSARWLVLTPGAAADRPSVANPARAADGWLRNETAQARFEKSGLAFGRWNLRLELMDDPTDTWSHAAANRFSGAKIKDVPWQAPLTVEDGPLRATLLARGAETTPTAWCRASLYAGSSRLRLRLTVTWTEIRRLLRLRVEAPGPISARTDLVSGGPLRRATDALEYPLGGGLLIEAAGERLGLVAPEVFSASVDTRSVMLTLLRSPYVAHHDPAAAGIPGDAPICDHGTHVFEIEFLTGEEAGLAGMARRAREMTAPPLVWDLTG